MIGVGVSVTTLAIQGPGTPAEVIDMSGILTGAAATDAGGELVRVTLAAPLASQLRLIYTVFSAGALPTITVASIGAGAEYLTDETARTAWLTDARYGLDSGTTIRLRVYDPAFGTYSDEASLGPVTIAQVAAPVINEASMAAAFSGLTVDDVASINMAAAVTGASGAQVSATGLPAELVDDGDGTVSGTLTAAGTVAVTVTADNRIAVGDGYRSNVGGVDTYTFNVTVDPLDPAVGPVTVWTDNGDGRAHAWPGPDPDYATTLAAEYSADGGSWTALTRPTIDDMASTVWLTGNLGAGTYSLRFRWVVDGTPGDPSTATSVTVTSTALATASLFEWAPSTAPTATLDAAYPTGTFADGERYVVAPAGVQVTARTITGTTSFGTMVFAGNPWSAGTEQSASEEIALSTNIPAGTVLAFATAGDGIAPSNTITRVMTLTVLSERPPAGSFRPTVFRDATTARRFRNVAEMDLSRLPRVPWAVDGQMPSAATIQSWFDRYAKRPAPPVGSSTVPSRNNYPSLQAGAYHRDVAGHFAYAGFVITSSQLADETLRRAVAIAYIQRAIDVIGGFESKRARSVSAESAYWWNGQIELAGLMMGDTRMRGIDFHGERGNNAYHAAANPVNAAGAFTPKIYRWADVQARSDANGEGARLFSTFKADTLQANTMGWSALLAPRTVTYATANAAFISRMENTFGLTFDGVDEWTIPANRFNNGMDTWWTVNAGAYAGHTGLLDPTPLWPADANSPPSADTANDGIGHFNRTYFVQDSATSGWGDGAGASPNSPFKQESYAAQHGPSAVAFGLLAKACGLDDYLVNVPNYLRFCEIWMTLPSGWYVANNLPSGFVSYNYQDAIPQLDEGADSPPYNSFQTQWMKARYLEHFDAPSPAIAKTAPAAMRRAMFSLANVGNGSEVTLTLLDVPHDGYSPITAVEYRIGSGSWVSIGGRNIGRVATISGLTPDAEISITVRAVNAIGNGEASGAQTITPVAFGGLVKATATARTISGSLSITVPEMVDGDFALLHVAVPHTATVSTPAGWSLVSSVASASGRPQTYVFSKFVSGATVGSYSQAITSASSNQTAHLVVLSEVAGTVGTPGTGTTGTATSHTPPRRSDIASGGSIASFGAYYQTGGAADFASLTEDPSVPVREGAFRYRPTDNSTTSASVIALAAHEGSSPSTARTFTTASATNAAMIGVHVPKLAAPNLTAVTITAAAVGLVVQASAVWTGYPRTGVTYQWTLDGVNITGATSATYTPVAGDLDGALRCVVTVNNGQGTDTATSDPQTVAEAVIAVPSVAWPTSGTNVSATVPGTYPAGSQVLLWLSEDGNSTSVTFGGVAMTEVARSTAHSGGRMLALWRADLSTTLVNPSVAIVKADLVAQFLAGIATAPQGPVTAVAAHSTSGTPTADLAALNGDVAYLGFASHALESGSRNATALIATGPGNISTNEIFGVFGSTGIRGMTATAITASATSTYTAISDQSSPASSYAAFIAVTVDPALELYTNLDPGGFTFDSISGTHIEIEVTEPAGYAGTYEVALADLYDGPVNLVAPDFTGTTAVGDTVTAVAGLWISASNVPTITRSWRSEDGATQLGTGATYTVASGDVSGGIILRESATDTNGGPVFEDTTVLVAVAASEPADFVVGVYDAVYDPSDLSTLWQDAAGTVAVTTDGDPVRRMDDKSGNNFHAVAPSDAARPIYRTAGGLHWLEFSGSPQTLEVTDPAFRLGDLAVFVAVEQSAESTNGRIVSFGASSTNQDWNNADAALMSLSSTSNLMDAYANNGTLNIVYAGAGNLPKSVVDLIKSTSSAELFTNGTSRGADAGPFTLNSNHTGKFRIASKDSASDFARINVYGLAIYSGHVIGSSNAVLVRTYMAEKIGVTL